MKNDRAIIFNNKVVEYHSKTQVLLPRNFESKLRQSDDQLKKLYTPIKNTLMAMSGVKSRMLKYDEVFRARGVIAKIRIKGKSLYVYLRIDPASVDHDWLKVVDKSHRNGFFECPCEIKVTGKRKLKRTIELIVLMGKALGLGKKRNFQPLDYAQEYPFIKNAVIEGKDKTIDLDR